MPNSIKQVVNVTSLDNRTKRELIDLLTEAQRDIAVLKAAINGITAKLDADGGVTDTNYSSLWPAAATNLLP
jgi:hypothetical protein